MWKLCHQIIPGDVYVVRLSDIAVADLRGGLRDAPGVQILSISCIFWENLVKSYVAAPPSRVGAPTSGKSSIGHCIGFQIYFDLFRFHKFSFEKNPFTKTLTVTFANSLYIENR